MSITNTMTLGRFKDQISQIRRNKFCSKTKKLAYFNVIAKKPVNIVFRNIIDNIKQLNQKYVIP